MECRKIHVRNTACAHRSHHSRVLTSSFSHGRFESLCWGRQERVMICDDDHHYHYRKIKNIGVLYLRKTMRERESEEEQSDRNQTKHKRCTAEFVHETRVCRFHSLNYGIACGACFAIPIKLCAICDQSRHFAFIPSIVCLHACIAPF